MRPFRADAVLFDFDGTLTKPLAIDFAAVREAVRCPPDSFILEYVSSLPQGAPRDEAMAILERFELEGAQRSEPNESAETTVPLLRDLGLRLGIITRNSRASVDAALARFAGLRTIDFDVIVTRDDPVAPKPFPGGVLLAAERLGVPPERLLMVGDYYLDVEAGKAAGAVTVFLTNGSNAPPDWAPASGLVPSSEGNDPVPDADFVIHRLDELEAVVRLGLPLPQGKLPNDLLAIYLSDIKADDPSLLVGAGVGEDVAALDIAGAEVLVVHGDPITLASDDLGRWAVLVNANDVATSGGEPRWFLTTVLLPPGTTASEALVLLRQIAAASAAQGISLVGGHTEITSAVTRPVVAATMAGTVRRADLRDRRRVAAGDHIVLTKRLAVEGTALLAHELGERLLALGMSGAELDACRGFVERMSVVDDARIAASFAGVTALHDVTEGGLATALSELSVACGRRVTVHRDRVPVYPETQRLCDVLGIDPLGLIGSGSLLLCCRAGESAALVGALEASGIEATVIGEMGEPGQGVTAFDGSRAASWPCFARDEAARLL